MRASCSSALRLELSSALGLRGGSMRRLERASQSKPCTGARREESQVKPMGGGKQGIQIIVTLAKK